MKFVKYENIWYWGETINLVKNDGLAIIELSIDNSKPNYAYISSLKVHTSARGQGIASAIMNEIENIARSKKVGIIYLSAEIGSWVAEWYQRIGYVEYSREELLINMYKKL